MKIFIIFLSKTGTLGRKNKFITIKKTTKNMSYDLAIIGAGCVGTAIAQRLCKYHLKILVLEKEEDVSMGTTKANSGIIHAGYAAPNGSLKAEMNVKGNAMFDEVCNNIEVEFKRVGSFVCAMDEKGLATIKKEKELGEKRGVKVEIIDDKAKIKAMEPNISEDVIAVLYAPSAGIIIPFELAVGLAEHSVLNGVEYKFNFKVNEIENPSENLFIIKSESGEKIESKNVINCAGVFSDKISGMVGLNYFKILPRRGEYVLLDKNVIEIRHILFPTPFVSKTGQVSKGILASPTLHGNIFAGPNAEEIESPDAINTTTAGLNEVISGSKGLIPNMPIRESITNFAGIRATSSNGDFIIEATSVKGFVNVAGIESPGLSSCLAIAEKVEGIVRNDLKIILTEKSDYIPKRKAQLRMKDMTYDKLQEKIKENPKWGTIVCRCETITEQEIVEACHAIIPAKSLDMIKRRLRPGMGRCQGGFCSPKVMKIISRELNIPFGEVTKTGKGSKIVIERTKGYKDEVYKEEEL